MSVSLNARLRGQQHAAVFTCRRAASPLAVTTTLVLIITLGALAAPSLDEWRPQAPPRQCDQIRQQLQELADAHYLQHNRWPDQHLSQLAGEQYLGAPVISCPTSGTRYEMSGSFVACPVHESERDR